MYVYMCYMSTFEPNSEPYKQNKLLLFLAIS